MIQSMGKYRSNHSCLETRPHDQQAHKDESPSNLLLCNLFLHQWQNIPNELIINAALGRFATWSHHSYWCTNMVALDMVKAFDTVNHGILPINTVTLLEIMGSKLPSRPTKQWFPWPKINIMKGCWLHFYSAITYETFLNHLLESNPYPTPMTAPTWYGSSSTNVCKQ